MGRLAYLMAELLKDRLREMRGSLRQKEMADKLGLPLETYRKWELGKRTPNKLAMAELESRLKKILPQPVNDKGTP